MTKRRRLSASVWVSFLAQNGPIIALILVVLWFSLQSKAFLTVGNSLIIGRAVAEMGIVALPMALLVIAGSIDLSVGSVLTVAAVLGAKVAIATGSVPLGFLAAVGFGVFAGVLNGILVCYMRLNPIVVTLGFLAVWAGVALMITNGATVAGLPAAFGTVGTARVFRVPLQIWLLVIVVIATWWLLNRRPYGRHLFAAGGVERAAFLMGVRVVRVRFMAHVLVGAAAGISGFLVVAKLQAATPVLGRGFELAVLTVVLLGGVAFAGGEGRVSGVVAALLIVGVLRNGLVITGTSQFLQQVVIGLTLVIAVALNDILARYRQTASVIDLVPFRTGVEPADDGESQTDAPSAPSSDVQRD